MASAGSGKTLSLLAKIGYIHDELGIPAKRILAISFTQKTVAELKERCRVAGVEIRTFHSLGNKILRSARVPTTSAKRLIADRQIAAFIRDYCERRIARDQSFARTFVDFVSYYYPVSTSPVRPQAERTKGEQCISGAEAYAALAKDEARQKDLDAFYQMLQTFLLLHKNGLYSLADIRKRLRSDDGYFARRNMLFRSIYQRVYCAYEQHLFQTRQYDFADMINAAKRQIEEVPGCARGYKYILLDEVQDLSRNRLLLIRAILRKNPGCKLFAVGDDWQSIYRFAGSDLTLIRDFEHIFGLTTRRSLIETTHRFGRPTIRISCGFIRRNPAQSRKSVRNTQKTATPIRVIFNKPTRQADGQDAESLRIVLQKLIADFGDDAMRQKSLQIISRYNRDILRIKSEHFEITPRADNADVFDVVWRKDGCAKLKLEFCSMHKSKGITRDIVIVLNMNAGLSGMPAVRESDPIIDALLAENEPYPFAEERRLFYVAITRAREATFLIADGKNPSPFIREILGDDYPKNT